MQFALALLSEQVDEGEDARSWTTLQGSTGEAGFVGIDGVTLSADSLDLAINKASTDGLVVDYMAQNLAVHTGPSQADEPTEFTLALDGEEGELLRASGNIDIDLYGFMQVSGGFAVEQKDQQITTLNTDETASTVDTRLLTIGANDASAFVGINGGLSNATGFNATGVDFALAMVSEIADASEGADNSTLRNWTSLQANVSSAGFIGVDGLTIITETLSVNINQAAEDGSVIDYSDGATTLVVLTGPASEMTFDMDGSRGELLQVSGQMTLDLFGFMQLDGGFALDKGMGSATLADSSEVEVSQLLLGAAGVDAFLGTKWRNKLCCRTAGC